MFHSRQVIAAAAVALCAAAAAPAAAFVPRDPDPVVAKLQSVWQVQGTKRCQHSLYVDASGAPAGRRTTGGARCVEA